MSWIFTTLSWYGYLLILGAIFYPFTRYLFSRFFDRGYPFAKTISIVITSYLVFLLGTLKILPFVRSSLLLILVIVLIGCLLYWLKKKTSLKQLLNEIKLQLPFFLIEEVMFLTALFFLAYIRGQEPSIRGLEKFMDFGFINSILRSRYFPPLDIWFSADPTHLQGYPINYYYFGHLTGAFLIKLTGVNPAAGYNLILATIFAQAVTLVFSLVGNLVHYFQQSVLIKKTVNYTQIILYGLFGSFIVNLAGNLHTIYLFTTGYQPDNPLPFWQILSAYNPAKYWYPNATRFIPFTIHEFPSYSYVVADLHGHVFDIPFVLLTLAVLFLFFIKSTDKITRNESETRNLKQIQNSKFQIKKLLTINYQLPIIIFLGFLTAIHYMTNAFDGPIYLLLSIIIITAAYRKLNFPFIISIVILLVSFIIFSLPFSYYFHLFANGIALNCSPQFLVNLNRIGPFIFEADKCQVSPLWMLFVLWGFFWVNFLIFLFLVRKLTGGKKTYFSSDHLYPIIIFILILFSFGTFLIFVPEFFYIKDIYPAHFRANTMFKLGYQAFIMMGIASSFVFFLIRHLRSKVKIILKLILILFFFFIFIYPLFAFPSYYGKLDRPVNLNGIEWLTAQYPEDKEIIDYLNRQILDQPVVLEAQGDSYTDYQRISSYTGLPTVAGWWVHEWLWRGSSDVVGKRIPDIVILYESKDLEETKKIATKYQIRYVVVSKLEREKYKNLYESKFNQIGVKVLETTNKLGALYQLIY